MLLRILKYLCILNLNHLQAHQIEHSTVATTSSASATVANSPNSGVCSSDQFSNLSPTRLGTGPIYIQSLISGANVCIQLTFRPSEASEQLGWFAVGFSRTGSMVSSPPANVMMYTAGSSPLIQSYLISAHSASGVTAETDQSGYTLGGVSTDNGDIKYTFQRSLQGSKDSEVPILPAGENNIIWAYASSFPISDHASGTYGSVKYDISLGIGAASSEEESGFCLDNNCAAIFGGGAFGIMVVLGLMLRAMGNNGFTKLILHTPLISAPKSVSNGKIQKPVPAILLLFADLSLGELIPILLVIGAIVGIATNLKNSTIMVTGQIIVLLLMFLLLPVSHIPVWGTIFGTSFERMVKYHRWLGMLLPIVAIWHFVKAYDTLDDMFTTKEYGGDVIPLHGFIAFCCMMATIVLALEPVRRSFFELFYFTHRILSILTIVFAILHSSKYIGLALMVPLIFYALGVLFRWGLSYFYKYQVTATAFDSCLTTSIIIDRSQKVNNIVSSMQPGSYYWIQIPTVSMIEWHPFTGIVTPDGKSIGFVIKTPNKQNLKKYTSRVFQNAKKNCNFHIRLCGPFGRPTIDVNHYKTIVLVAGGVGITPMLSIINQLRCSSSQGNAKVAANHDLILIWSVRDAQDLLMVDEYLPTVTSGPIGSIQTDSNVRDTIPHTDISFNLYVSTANNDGIITRSNGELINYHPGRPILDEFINNSRFIGGNVAVMACGPPSLVTDAQRLAKDCRYPFHKEVFAW